MARTRDEILEELKESEERLARAEEELRNLEPRLASGEDMAAIDRDIGIFRTEQQEMTIKIYNLKNELVSLG